jgi:hypothetical protein
MFALLVGSRLVYLIHIKSIEVLRLISISVQLRLEGKS